MADSNLYQRLKKLFSTSVIVRNVGGKQLKVADTDNVQAFMSNAVRDKYSRIHAGSQAYSGTSYGSNMAYQTQRIMLFRDYDCISGDTRIPLPDGSEPTIRELSERYSENDNFYVFSYDLVNEAVVLGNAHSIKKKGTSTGVKITFDNGKTLLVTVDHPVLMRDGNYRLAGDVMPGDSVMPFYRKDFYNNGYRCIYNFNKGWQSEHRIIAEQFLRPLEHGEVVHHIDFDKTNNIPTNLCIMGDSEHRAYHCKIINGKLWSEENRERQIAAIRAAVANRSIWSWKGTRQGTGNPFFGKQHSASCNHALSDRMKSWHSENDYKSSKNPNYRHDLTEKRLLDVAKEIYITTGKLNQKEFLNTVECDISTLRTRIPSWFEFKKNVIANVNHKVTSVEVVDEIELFDMTVDGFSNFATTECFIHNCMDNDPIIASALDIYSDESTVKNEFGEILTITSDNSEVKEVLHNLFYDILNIEFNLWPWVRNLCKYGDFFLFLEISPKYGIHNVLPLSVYDTTRLEGENKENPYYVCFETLGMGGGKQKFENYEIAHFRLLSDANFLPYGKAMLENARRIFRQLTLMEDAMMIHRIMRAPEKRVYKIDIGNIQPNEVDAYIQKLMDRSKKVPFVDPTTGEYNLRYNMQNIMEDFYLPVRGGDSGTSIENLGGLEYNGIEDVDYLKQKLFAALKIPKAFLGYDENVNGKATLAAEDVRFARTIERIQRILISELTKIATVHLYAQGYKDEELVNFSLSLTNPSTIYEQEKVNLWTQKAGLAAQLQGTKMFSRDWMYANVWDMSEDEANEEKDKLVKDAKDIFRVTQIEQGQSDPAKFGFPQDQEPQDPNAMAGGEMGGAPPGGAPSGAPGGDPGAAGPESGAAPPGPQVTSVDQLPTAQELGLEENLEEDDRGAPKKGPTYAQDSHVRGRDPLGFKERYSAMHVGKKRHDKPKSPLSLETKAMLSPLIKKINKAAPLLETEAKPKKAKKKKPNYLDDTNIIDNE